MTAPYLLIAADLRHRVESGRLRPGDRLPSTRQIARDLGVAIATATKALATLRQEGLTHARPGVGDEWMRQLGPVEPRLPEFELDLDLLVRFGLRSLLDGLQVLVDRRAAA